MTESAVYRNALQLGAMLLEYRLDAVLGAGGFGLTYLAWDGHLEKHVAIKEYLPAELALRALDGTIVPVTTNREYDYQWGLERFLQEARTLARFTHPHIVRVNRYFEANGTAYMVMDYEKGESMSQLLKRAPLPEEAKLRAILMPLLDGLRAVHEAGFLHRDIKPSNIFLRESGSPVLIDFGAARHAVWGARDNYTSVLTPGYAPLEQYTADGRQGAWSDIYALSAVFCRAVTNQNPPDAVSRLRGDTLPQMLAAARDRYSEELLEALNWGVAMDDERRPRSVADWQVVLSGGAKTPLILPVVSVATARQLAKDIPTIVEPRGSSKARRRWSKVTWIGFGSAAALMVVAGAAWQLGTQYVQPLTTLPPPVIHAETAAPAIVSSQPAPPPHVEHTKAPQHRRVAVRRAHTPPHPNRNKQIVLSPDQLDSVGEEPQGEVAKSKAAPVTMPARAPVRDAVLLPPLAAAGHERPTRDRSPRPGEFD